MILVCAADGDDGIAPVRLARAVAPEDVVDVVDVVLIQDGQFDDNWMNSPS
jgi:hypothetical protein